MISIYDFKDSFTYNLFADLKYLGQKVQVIEFEDILSHIKSIDKNTKQVIVLGPGPGHPDEYQVILQSINKLMGMENIFILGVCLGHQLVAQALGMDICNANEIIHGQSVVYNVPKSIQDNYLLPTMIRVQRYNSLAPVCSIEIISKLEKSGYLLLVENNELIIISNKNLVTYQFHIESIGTSCHENFYRPAIEFLL